VEAIPGGKEHKIRARKGVFEKLVTSFLQKGTKGGAGRAELSHNPQAAETAGKDGGNYQRVGHRETGKQL